MVCTGDHEAQYHHLGRPEEIEAARASAEASKTRADPDGEAHAIDDPLMGMEATARPFSRRQACGPFRTVPTP